ncbi:DUF427 domain-containing protein [Arthrobacter sp. H5]|uniref:DUF427 domain-containing protein n=1 Tax=Arthrobacter sp. H5 TaxID=1267973 RepID=UPI00047F310F|nr:DUF427 domain-containing protein [Arthrobacter sp. H5]
MATQISSTIFGLMDQLRYEPTGKRIRAYLNDTPIVDTHRALLVWEPKRVTPIFAVPEEDVRAELTAADADQTVSPEYPIAIMLDAPPALDPRTKFSRHTTPGNPLTITTADGASLPAAAFRTDDTELAGHVLLDFDAFSWREDDESIFGHPRDPFHRIDVRHTSAAITVAVNGTTLADTTRAELLYETFLPPRIYIPADDVHLDVLESSQTRSVCPYKGIASYFSYPASPQGTDIVWQYDSSFLDAAQIHGLLCFFNERVDLTVDGVTQEKPVTPWS